MATAPRVMLQVCAWLAGVCTLCMALRVNVGCTDQDRWMGYDTACTQAHSTPVGLVGGTEMITPC